MRQPGIGLLRPGARLLGIAAALALLGAGGAPSPSDLEALIKDGKLEEAIAAGRAAVEASPSNPDLRGALAHALAAKGRSVRRVVATTVDAEDLVVGKAAVPRIGPDNPPKIEIVYDPALFEEALRHIRAAIRMAPTRKDLRLTECYLLTDAGDVDRAAAAVREALSALPRAPSLAPDLASFGVERAKRGDPRGGLVLLQPVSEAFPNDAPLAADRGFILAQADRKKEALAELDRAVKLAPADLRVLRRRATALSLLREWRRAREGWKVAFEAGREEGDRLGAAAAAVASDLNTAKNELRDLAVPASSADPTLAELAASLLKAASAPAAARGNIALAKKLADGGKELLAVPVLHRALKADPRLEDAAFLLAGIERRFGFPSVAEAILRDARPRGPSPAKPGPKRPSVGPT
jgi:tetratricopeptide (TPR) repeat protein